MTLIDDIGNWARLVAGEVHIPIGGVGNVDAEGECTMSDTDGLPRSDVWKTAFTVLQEAAPPFIPEGAHAITVLIEYPPGDPGAPPHRHHGPAFGYVLEGEMRFELEGDPVRILRAGETFWEPGGDVIHYQDGNNSTDAKVRFIATMMCVPGQPMLTLVDEEELAQRRHLRAAPA